MESATSTPGDDLAAVEQSIAALRGVQSCRILTTESGEIAEIHVVAEGRAVHEIIDEMEALFRVQLGYVPDRQKISVALLGKEKAAVEERRPELHGFMVQKTKTGVRVRVELLHRKTVYVGEADSGSSTGGVLPVSAAATLKAVQSMVGHGVGLRLDEVTVVPVDDVVVAMVGVSVQKEGTETVLLGASLVRHDEAEAVIRACLDAVNRYFYAVPEERTTMRTGSTAAAVGAEGKAGAPGEIDFSEGTAARASQMESTERPGGTAGAGRTPRPAASEAVAGEEAAAGAEVDQAREE